MASRTDWLTEVARPVAKELAQRCGSLKRVVSAGVMILNDASPEIREYYMAKAAGADLSGLEDPDDEFRRKVHQICSDLKVLPKDKKSARQKKNVAVQ